MGSEPVQRTLTLCLTNLTDLLSDSLNGSDPSLAGFWAGDEKLVVSIPLNGWVKITGCVYSSVTIAQTPKLETSWPFFLQRQPYMLQLATPTAQNLCIEPFRLPCNPPGARFEITPSYTSWAHIVCYGLLLHTMWPSSSIHWHVDMPGCFQVPVSECWAQLECGPPTWVCTLTAYRTTLRERATACHASVLTVCPPARCSSSNHLVRPAQPPRSARRPLHSTTPFAPQILCMIRNHESASKPFKSTTVVVLVVLLFDSKTACGVKHTGCTPV